VEAVVVIIIILLVIGFIVKLVTDWFVYLLIFIGIVIAFWVVGIFFVNKSAKAKKEQELTKFVLSLAAESEEDITPAELVLKSEDLTIEEAREHLEKMKAKGLAHLRIAEDGTYLYRIQGILTHKAKEDSERV